MYGVRLSDLFRRDADGVPLLTWRELGVYVRGLPPDAATRTAWNDGRPEPSLEAIVIADAIDTMRMVRWQVAAIGATKDSELPKLPAPYSRPWTPARGGRKNDPERVARLDDARKRAAERKRQIANGQIT